MKQHLQFKLGHKTILDLMKLQEDHHLNLEPGFQRKSVWRLKHRQLLIRSILQGYPMPSIFLYQREQDGQLMYDVLDGKQRLETIFMFSRTQGFGRSGFHTRFQFSEDETPHDYDWKKLQQRGHVAGFQAYEIPTIEVSTDDFAELIDLFVRINSTGMPLTSSEKRHARYYKSSLLAEAARLARRHCAYLTEQHVITAAQIDRMKDVELVTELLASILFGGPIHKKQAVDRAVGNEATHAATLKRALGEFTAVLGIIKRLLPRLRSTRFRNVSEFYTLFMLVWEMRHEGLILTDPRLLRVAEKLLTRLSDGVDAVRELQRKAKGATPEQQLFADYLLSVQQSTDGLGQRKRRAEILRGVLATLFQSKDDRRIFTPEQRRLLWNSDEKGQCRECETPLSWENFQVDHVKPHSRGGRTHISNAALICVSCNASKGARARPLRAS